MIPESEIPQNPEHEVKPKFQVGKNRYGHILFRTDVYFTEYLLAVEIDEKNMLAETVFFEKKRQKALEKNFVVNLQN